MSIQQAINSALAIGAALATQSPAYKKQKNVLKENSLPAAEPPEETAKVSQNYGIENSNGKILSAEAFPEMSTGDIPNYLYSDTLAELAKKEARMQKANIRSQGLVRIKRRQKEMIKNGNK